MRGFSAPNGPDGAVRRQRKHDESRGGEEQRVVQLLFGQDRPDESVEAGAQREKDRDRDGRPAASAG